MPIAIVIAVVTMGVRVAKAEEPRRPGEPFLMAEPGAVTDVVDAFDQERGDPFDLHLSLGFSQRWQTGAIRRESYLGPDGRTSTGGFTSDVENIASYRHTTSTLDMRADVGLWHDIGLFFRLPLILSDNRSLGDLNGSQAAVNERGRASDPATGDPLFRLPFRSPQRSGVDYVAAGLRWSIFNQFRDPSKPTWTWEVEGRFAVGEPLHACNDDAQGNLRCPGLTSDPNDPPVFRDGRWTRNERLQGRSPGISRGTNAIRVSTVVSNRFRYIEPYGGFWFLAEWQRANTDIGNYAGVQGVITNRPPVRGALQGGIMLHPWENREQYQRLTIDLRVEAQYVSQGRDYSPLFDALGSSSASSLVAPNPATYRAGVDVNGNPTSVGDYSRPIPFTGVTDAEAHAVFGGRAGVILQAARYVRFSAGLGVAYVQPHAITAADACNPDVLPSDTSRAGRCRVVATNTATGTPNPNHRPILDLPGRRFRIADTFIWDAWISVTAMF